MYLIDTDVLSALRRRVRAPNLLAWISAQRTADLYLSTATTSFLDSRCRVRAALGSSVQRARP